MRLIQLAALVALGFSAVAPPAVASGATPVERHGALAVVGNRIVDAHGEALSLAGPSLFWSNSGWEGHEDRYYNARVVRQVARDWQAGIIRAAIGGTSRGGYIDEPRQNLRRARRVVDAALREGLYVIVDWHAHDAERHPELAIAFFEDIARRYGRHPNLIYEIYNEPLADTDWAAQVKPYAERVIARIRAIDPDNLIVVGTQSWSQDVDKAAADPLQGQVNVAYALHFYAGTHGEALREKARHAMAQGIALMVTEWGTVNADGDGPVAREETERWLACLREHHLSHLNWALGDKREGAAQLRPGTPANGRWSEADLTESGRYVRAIIRGWDAARP